MRLGYTIIYVPNVPATVLFYERAFGLKCRMMAPGGDYAELETGATALAFANETFVAGWLPSFTANRPAEKPAGVEIGFVTEDVAKSYRQAVSAGATPLVEPMQKPWGQTVSYVRDNNGFLVELCSKVG